MLKKLESVAKRYEVLNQLMAEPYVAADFERLEGLAKEHVGISERSINAIAIGLYSTTY